MLQSVLDQIGNRHEGLDALGLELRRDASTSLAEVEPQEVQRGQLRGERLGARNTDLWARVRV